jgi:hypothetical protein
MVNGTDGSTGTGFLRPGPLALAGHRFAGFLFEYNAGCGELTPVTSPVTPAAHVSRGISIRNSARKHICFLHF